MLTAVTWAVEEISLFSSKGSLSAMRLTSSRFASSRNSTRSLTKRLLPQLGYIDSS